MSEHKSRSAANSFDAIVFDEPRPAYAPRGRIIEFRPAVRQVHDGAERERVRWARRQALLLMICSGLVSLAVLYGIWTLLLHLLFRAG